MAYTGYKKKTFGKSSVDTNNASNKPFTLTVTKVGQVQANEKRGTVQRLSVTDNGSNVTVSLYGHREIPTGITSLTVTPGKTRSGYIHDDKGNYAVFTEATISYEAGVQGAEEEAVTEVAHVDTTGKNSTRTMNSMQTKEVTREDFRSEAETSVEANLESASRIAKKLKLTGVDLVALGDLIGRTISALSISAQRQR